jgi:hypothetical protein
MKKDFLWAAVEVLRTMSAGCFLAAMFQGDRWALGLIGGGVLFICCVTLKNKERHHG